MRQAMRLIKFMMLNVPGGINLNLETSLPACRLGKRSRAGRETELEDTSRPESSGDSCNL